MVGFLVSIVPSAGALFLFWLALRAIFQADRRERAAIDRYDAENRSAEAEGAHPEIDFDPDADPDLGPDGVSETVDEAADGAGLPRAGT